MSESKEFDESVEVSDKSKSVDVDEIIREVDGYEVKTKLIRAPGSGDKRETTVACEDKSNFIRAPGPEHFSVPSVDLRRSMFGITRFAFAEKA